MGLFTEDQLREMLKKRIGKNTLSVASKRIGISISMLSMLVNGYPMTGKAVAYLGFRKVRRRLYEPLTGKHK